MRRFFELLRCKLAHNFLWFGYCPCNDCERMSWELNELDYFPWRYEWEKKWGQWS